jgi:hypothetical protein
MSERARGVVRRGLVYGIAGAMTVGEAAIAAGRGVAQGAEQVASSAGDLAGDLIGEAQGARRESADGRAESDDEEADRLSRSKSS